MAFLNQAIRRAENLPNVTEHQIAEHPGWYAHSCPDCETVDNSTVNLALIGVPDGTWKNKQLFLQSKPPKPLTPPRSDHPFFPTDDKMYDHLPCRTGGGG